MNAHHLTNGHARLSNMRLTLGKRQNHNRHRKSCKSRKPATVLATATALSVTQGKKGDT